MIRNWIGGWTQTMRDEIRFKLEVELPVQAVMGRVESDANAVGISSDEFVRGVWHWMQEALERSNSKEWMYKEYMRLAEQQEAEQIIEGETG